MSQAGSLKNPDKHETEKQFDSLAHITEKEQKIITFSPSKFLIVETIYTCIPTILWFLQQLYVYDVEAELLKEDTFVIWGIKRVLQ